MLTLLPPSPAFVIHSREYQEHSLLIEFFTLNHGRVSAIAKRVKTGRSPFKYLLQPFFPLNVSFKQGKSDLWQVYDVEPSGELISFFVPEVFCASYLNELLYYLYKSKESDPKLFASYLETLKGISEKTVLDKALREFEFALLDSLGYGIRFEDKDGNKKAMLCSLACFTIFCLISVLLKFPIMNQSLNLWIFLKFFRAKSLSCF